MHYRFAYVFLLLVAAAGSGCAGYAERVAGVRSSLLAGNKAAALAHTNKALEVKEANDYPVDLDGEVPLLLLERGTIKHGMESYAASAQDLKVADATLEVLDFKNDTMGNIGKFLFSDDASEYRPPPYEKLLLNTYGMLNYLALGDLESARVEARRFQVMRTYLQNEEEQSPPISSFGSYLAGLTFELSDRYEEAMRHYGDALSVDQSSVVVESVTRMLSCTNHRPRSLPKDLVAPEGATCGGSQGNTGDVVVISHTGLAPHKIPKRIPIGAAVAIAGAALGAATHSELNRLMGRGLVTWVNFPELKATKSAFKTSRVRIGGELQHTFLGADIETQVVEAWKDIQGILMVAAITRLVARAVAGLAAEKAAKSGGSSSITGLLIGMAVTGGLAAADTPDTRSWVSLPAGVWITRATLPAGPHTVAVTFEGPGGRQVMEREVQVTEGKVTVLSLASMR